MPSAKPATDFLLLHFGIFIVQHKLNSTVWKEEMQIYLCLNANVYLEAKCGCFHCLHLLFPQLTY